MGHDVPEEPDGTPSSTTQPTKQAANKAQAISGASTNAEFEAKGEEPASKVDERSTADGGIVAVDPIPIRQGNRSKQDESLLNGVISALPFGVVLLDPNLCLVYINPPAQTALNLTSDDLGTPLARAAANLDDPAVVADAKQVLEAREPIERPVQGVDGRRYCMRLQPHAHNGVDGLMLTFADITRHAETKAQLREHRDRLEQRIAERTTELERMVEALRISQERYRVLVETSPDLIARFDREKRHLFVNSAVEKMTGLSRESYVGKTNAELGYSEQFIVLWDDAIDRVFETGDPTSLKFSFTDPDGQERHLHSLLAPELSEAGEVTSVISVVRDLTELEKAASALETTSIKYETLFKGAANPIAILDREANFLLLNAAVAEALDTTEDALIGASLGDVVPQYLGVFRDRIRRVLTCGKPIHAIDSPTTPKGQRWYLTITQPIRDVPAWGEAVQLIAYDITERVNAQRELEKSKARLQRIMEYLPAGVIHRVGDRLWINRAVEEITGYRQEEISTADDWFGRIYGPAAEERRADHIRRQAAGFPESTTLEIIRKDGERRWVEFSGFALEDDNDITVLHDVTVERNSTAALEAAVEEKVTLLRELYHRTKNNMQVISAILALQSRQIEDPEALTAIEETQTRIRSIGIVHEKLYESENLSRIDLGAYVVDLVEMLFQTYETEAGDITPRLDLEKVPVVIDIAIPCGLVINELIANTLKHGFPNGEKGEMRIVVSETDDEVLLIVEDNGVGAPEGFDFRRANTLGVQSIFGIVEHQLQGDVTFDSRPGEGVSCHITFPKDRYAPRI